MSYILDALKRSEQERHQGELTHATIDTIMIPKKQANHHWWPYVLIVVLCLNILVFLYAQFFLEDKKNQSGNEMPLSATKDTSYQQLSLANKETEASLVASLDSPSEKALPAHLMQTPKLQKRYDMNKFVEVEATTNSNEAVKVKHSEEGFEIIRPKNYSEDSPAIEMPEVKTDYKSASYANVESNKVTELSSKNGIKQNKPTTNNTNTSKVEKINFDMVTHINDMTLDFQKQMPDIRFNSHIYSPDPADRRVMINDLYLREGQDFSGVMIESIGEFYIVLSKRSQRFKIPVLRDWYSPQ